MVPGISIVVGLLLLIAGAEFLVRGASTVAKSLGVPSLAIGLTVVAYGTSAPELTVSIVSTLQGANDIALGNVVGSNIFNVLFILGACALILPLEVTANLIRRDVPVMIGVSAVAFLMVLGLTVTRLEGLVLAAGLLLYTTWTLRAARQEGTTTDPNSGDATEDGSRKPTKLLASLALIVVSLVALVVGSRTFVQGAVWIAQVLGVSDLVIGLTIVAAGTSLPEVATSIVATVRGERDIAVGNVVGSNIFNVLGVLGISAIVAPTPGVPVSLQSVAVDVPFMLVVSLACLPVFVSGRIISRWEGGVFLVYYGAYTTLLILLSQGTFTLDRPLLLSLALGLPLLAVTLLSLFTRQGKVDP